MGYFDQETEYVNIPDRLSFFQSLIQDKKALHVGCADAPIFDLSNNLHGQLLSKCSNLQGYDIDQHSVSQMKEHSSFKDAIIHTELPKESYDFILMPEVVEHVTNPKEVLRQLFTILNVGGTFLLTAPNAFSYYMNQQRNEERNGVLIHYETVHPDHCYWFSVYTLPSLIRKCFDTTQIKIETVGVTANESMVFVVFSKVAN